MFPAPCRYNTYVVLGNPHSDWGAGRPAKKWRQQMASPQDSEPVRGRLAFKSTFV